MRLWLLKWKILSSISKGRNKINKLFKKRPLELTIGLATFLLLNYLGQNISPDNFRYFLSAVAQSLAALLAIGITSYALKKEIPEYYENLLGHLFEEIRVKYENKQLLSETTKYVTITIVTTLISIIFLGKNKFIDHIFVSVSTVLLILSIDYFRRLYEYNLTNKNEKDFLNQINTYILSANPLEIEGLIRHLNINGLKLTKNSSQNNKIMRILLKTTMTRYAFCIKNYNTDKPFHPEIFLKEYFEILKKTNIELKNDIGFNEMILSPIFFNIQRSMKEYVKICSEHAHFKKYCEDYFEIIFELIKTMYHLEYGSLAADMIKDVPVIYSTKYLSEKFIGEQKNTILKFGEFIVRFADTDIDLYINMINKLSLKKETKKEICKQLLYLKKEWEKTYELTKYSRMNKTSREKRELFNNRMHGYYGYPSNRVEYCETILRKYIKSKL